MIQIIKSTEDNSINFVDETPAIGNFESRYVRRAQPYFIAYLSAQSGCDQACRMCHLTATGQNDFVNATLDDFFFQAYHVLKTYKQKVADNIEPPADHMHFNFMARGEHLNNPVLHSKEVFQELRTLLLKAKMIVKKMF
jgi:adenine C2-methylase RlmN of 23S rRNA A2503 and tRNA A37